MGVRCWLQLTPIQILSAKPIIFVNKSLWSQFLNVGPLISVLVYLVIITLLLRFEDLAAFMSAMWAQIHRWLMDSHQSDYCCDI